MTKQSRQRWWLGSISWRSQAFDVGKGLHKKRSQTELPNSISADKPATIVDLASACGGQEISSLVYAKRFATWFLKWCARVGETGPIDWPKLQILALEFAESEGLRPPTPMALEKALASIGIRKRVRAIESDEKGLVSHARSRSARPRVTVYHIPRSENNAQHRSANDEPDLFD